MAKQVATNTPKTKKKTSKRSLVNAICIIFLSLCVVGSAITFVLVQNILAKPQISQGMDKLTSNSSSVLYDRDGKEITILSGESGVRENIKYDEIPQVVIDAFLSIEDSRFFKHSGFDLPRFIKSGWSNVVSGGIVQGGSTLTMQLVDVKLFPKVAGEPDQTTVQKLEQKVVEIFKSMDIESKIDKKKIIELYLNSINFGGPARGIQKGAQYYFGKDAKNLTLTEAAFLAGVINAPGSYNPYNANMDVIEGTPTEQIPATKYELATKRRNNVLYQMHNHGYIDDNEYALARSSELALQLNGAKNFATEANQSFIDIAVKEAIEKTGKDPHVVPMKIYTTMDRSAQTLADAILNGEAGVTFPDERMTAGFTATNIQGEILAIGGGRSYSGDQRKNHGAEFAHQIGSTAKPIVEYAGAFEWLGYGTEHVIEDSPTAYTDANTTLFNADRQFHGDVTLKQAIGHSYNIPAYKTLKALVDEIGQDGVIKMLNKMGIDQITKENFMLGISIGGGDLSMTPLELAGAYSVFANKGNYVEPHTITKIVFEDEKTKTYEADPKKNSAFSDETAYLMSYMLRDAVTGGYGTINGLNGPYPIYAKSGTTDNQETGVGVNIPMGVAKDKWMAAYTDQYVVSTWVGYEDYLDPNNYFNESKLYLNIEGKITRALLDDLTGGVANEIAKPAGVTNLTHVQGVFPYASSSNGKMVTSLIRQKFAKLSGNVNATPDPISDLDSISISLDDDALSISFPQYSGSGGSTKTVRVGDVSFTFTPLFNKNSITGGVQYKFEIYVNGALVDSGASGSHSISRTIDSLSGDEIKVCGYYAYASADGQSNKICKSLTSNASNKMSVSGLSSLFASTTSFEEASSAVNAWASLNLPDVSISVVESTSVGPGKFDAGASTIKDGMYVVKGDSYIVAIGK